jgi:hypothetical protein
MNTCFFNAGREEDNDFDDFLCGVIRDVLQAPSCPATKTIRNKPSTIIQAHKKSFEKETAHSPNTHSALYVTTASFSRTTRKESKEERRGGGRRKDLHRSCSCGGPQRHVCGMRGTGPSLWVWPQSAAELTSTQTISSSHSFFTPLVSKKKKKKGERERGREGERKRERDGESEETFGDDRKQAFGRRLGGTFLI